MTDEERARREWAEKLALWRAADNFESFVMQALEDVVAAERERYDGLRIAAARILDCPITLKGNATYQVPGELVEIIRKELAAIRALGDER